jgi:hypothetical protein
MSRKRFIDSGEYLSGFTDEFLVTCPRCGGCAKVALDIGRGDASEGWRAPRKVVCPACSYYKVWDGDAIVTGEGVDWYFRLPLWLQVPCCGEVLWAYNEYHLSFLEDYVGSSLRERHPNQNRALASRLPSWIKEAKNREAVLKCIHRLKAKLPRPTRA